ncbi:MAG: phenylalanine--tRNA ligase subunit beta [Neomegalonema sp.]|nr:phenylalanine--tRNA ligase subunit beta [Neomegalonema sp.]
MKFTLSWLKDHLETEASLPEILEALTDLGLEVEEVVDPAERLGAFRICKVIEARQHPNADKLRLCRVQMLADGPKGADDLKGKAEEIQVVCGAVNAKTGLIGVLARPGDYVPGLDVTLKEGEIRGEASMGMLCSEEELELAESSEGILELPADAPVGARYIDYAGLNDPMIEIAITPNRPDALGVRGVARDLAARGLGRLKDEAAPAIEGRFASPVKVTLDKSAREEIEGRAACPLFVGRMVRGVKNGPSPAWLQKRLKAIGINPKNALVDITNYISFDRARPLHVFDMAKLSGNIKVRLAKQGERILGLDDVDYALEEGMTLVCDQGGRRPAAIGGVMGGAETGCSGETVDVFIESAYFDPIRTATTGRKLRINSDARYRFERGIDPASAELGCELATRMVLEFCGGEPSELVIAGRVPTKGANGIGRKFKLDTERVVSLVGMEIAREEQVRILEALGFEIGNPRQKVITAKVPSWRPDIHGEADLVEEVARVASLTKLEARPLPRLSSGVAKPVLTPAQRRLSLARRTLAARGANECVTYTFISEKEAALFGGGAAAMKLENPISSEMSDMRPSLLPGLLAAAQRNQARGAAQIALFEVGPEFFGGEPGEQREAASLIRVGFTAARDWSGTRRPVDLYDAKADAEALLAALGAPTDKLMLDRAVSPWFHPGRAGRLKLGPKVVLAEFGELHPKVIREMGIRNASAVAMSVDLAAIPAKKAKSTARPPLTLNEFQAVERDFAFVVDAQVEAGEILRAVRGADKKLIEDASVFDVFEGKRAVEQLGEGRKSVAVSVRLQPVGKTLTDEEIEGVADKVIQAAQRAVGATLRG